MNVTVTLDGTAVEVEAGTLTIDDGIDERAVCRFTVVDPDGTVGLHKGQRVKVTSGEGGVSGDVTVNAPDVTMDNAGATVNGEGGTGTAATIYDGYLERSETQALPGPMRLHSIEAVDHHYLADKRIAAITYTSKTVKEIVTDLHNRYLKDEGVILGNVDDGPIVDLIVFPYVPVSEALTELADLAGYWWYLTTFKSLDFRQRESFVAPWTLTADPLDVPYDSSTTIIRVAPDYRNVQYVRNVKDLTDPQTERFKGDGEVQTFNVGFDLAQVPTVTVNGSPKTVGIRGVETGKAWYWNKGDTAVTQDDDGTPLGAADILQVVYVGQFDAVIISDDQDAITDRQTVEGGTGKVEHVVDDRRIDGRHNAFVLAAAKLKKYGQIGRTFQFTTRRSGLRPGMLLPVLFDPYQLDTEMLVVSVETFDFAGVEFRWTVTAVEGPHDESWSRFFARLYDVPEVLVWSENTSDVPILTRLFEFDREWTDADNDPNPFLLVYPADALAVSDTLFPQIDPDDRVRWVEVTHDGDVFRKVLTQRAGLNTDEIVSTLYLGPNDANGAVTEVAWFGGTGASATVGSGDEIGRLLLVDVKTTAEAWNLIRTDSRAAAPADWWETGDVPEGVYG